MAFDGGRWRDGNASVVRKRWDSGCAEGVGVIRELLDNDA